MTAEQNLPEIPGLRMERKGGLLYVYLETPDARAMAPGFLPATKARVLEDGTEVRVYNVGEEDKS